MNKWLSPELWNELTAHFIAWASGALPAILLVLLLSLVAQEIFRGALNRLKPHMLRRIEEGSVDAGEAGKRVETLFGILSSVVRVSIGLVATLLVLKNVGIDIGPILAGAGVVGLAVGFGAQELVRDVISGFFLLLENHVRTGDVANVNGTGGLVEQVGLRTLILRDQSGTVHVFQNGKISSLSNLTKDWSAAVLDISVEYRQDTDEVVEVLRSVDEDLRSDPAFASLILEPIEIFGVDRFEDSAVIVKARIKTKPIQQWNVGREFRRRLKKAFQSRGIVIPFPQRTVSFDATNWKPEQLLAEKAS